MARYYVNFNNSIEIDYSSLVIEQIQLAQTTYYSHQNIMSVAHLYSFSIPCQIVIRINLVFS